MKVRKLLILSIVILLASCVKPEDSKQSDAMTLDSPPQSFDGYWRSNGAEISSYRLEQARYGEIHSGTAVLVYVTEPFSESKQVKLDNYKAAGADRLNVLKLNLSKKFLTGIYPYSMMLSTFTPLDGSPMIKSTTSSQEWCGHTWLQLNRLDTGYRYTGFSYFESEGDQTGETSSVMSEDQIWTQIRLDPDKLPLGSIQLLPSTFYLRLRHQSIQPQSCMASLSKEGEVYQYSLVYDNRTLTISFEGALPHRILEWEESYPSGFGNTQNLTTKASLMNTIRSRYWGKNSNEDRKIREELGLATE